MKYLRAAFLVLGLCGVLAAARPVFAEEASGSYIAPPQLYTAGDKLVRGLANVFLGFIEIPRNIHNTTQDQSLLAGWTVGLGEGFGYTVLRFAVGIYEVVTFPFPLPEDYKPVYEPEFVWQAPGPRYK